MGTNRDKAHEVNDGLIIASESDFGHLSTGTAVPTHTGKLGDLYWQGGVGSWWRLEADGNDWKQATSSGKIGALLSFEGNANPFLSVVNPNFELVGSFSFSGTTLLGVPQTIKLIASVNSGATGEYKIFDETNLLQIALLTGVTNTIDEISDMGTLANLPSNEAIFEVQMRRSAGGGAINISALELGFT